MWLCQTKAHLVQARPGDVPGDPVAKTLCSLGRGPSSIPRWGTRSCMLQLSSHAATKRSCVPQLRPSTAKYITLKKIIISLLHHSSNKDEPSRNTLTHLTF